MQHVLIPSKRGFGRAGYSRSHFALLGMTQPAPVTFCGAPLTGRDVRPIDVRRGRKHTEWLAGVCPTCIRLCDGLPAKGK